MKNKRPARLTRPCRPPLGEDVAVRRQNGTLCALAKCSLPAFMGRLLPWGQGRKSLIVRLKNKLLLIIGALLTMSLVISLVLNWRDGNWEALKTIGYILMIASLLMFVIFTPLWRRFRDETNAAMLKDYGEESFFYAQRKQQEEQTDAVRRQATDADA